MRYSRSYTLFQKLSYGEAFRGVSLLKVTYNYYSDVLNFKISDTNIQNQDATSRHHHLNTNETSRSVIRRSRLPSRRNKWSSKNGKTDSKMASRKKWPTVYHKIHRKTYHFHTIDWISEIIKNTRDRIQYRTATSHKWHVQSAHVPKTRVIAI